MSDRDELADVVFSVNGDHDALDAQAIADAVLMAGWRKMPSRDDLADALVRRVRFGNAHPENGEVLIDAGSMADAILALMDGDTDDR